MEASRNSGSGKHSGKRLCRRSPAVYSMCDKGLYILAVVLETLLHSQIQLIHNVLWGASMPFVGVLLWNAPFMARISPYLLLC